MISVKEKSAKISELLDGDDTKSLTLLIHSIKSTSRAIGAKELSDMAAEIEKSADKEKTVLFIEKYEMLGEKIDNALRGM